MPSPGALVELVCNLQFIFFQQEVTEAVGIQEHNKASVARHADDKQDFTLLEQDQPMAEEEEEGVRVGREEEGLQWEGQREERWAGTRGGFIN